MKTNKTLGTLNGVTQVAGNWDGVERRKMGTELQEILTKLHALDINLELVRQEVKGNHKSFRDVESEWRRINEKLTHTIYGNGQEGLTSKINSLDSIKNELKDHTRQDGFYMKLFVGLISSCLGGIGWIITKMLAFHGGI